MSLVLVHKHKSVIPSVAERGIGWSGGSVDVLRISDRESCFFFVLVFLSFTPAVDKVVGEVVDVLAPAINNFLRLLPCGVTENSKL